MARLVIYGSGGFGRELITTANADSRELVFMSDTPAEPFDGFPVIGLSDILPDDEIVIAVGDSAVRKRLADKCPDQFGSLRAPTVIIGRGCEIGEGAVFCDFSMVTTSAKIGRHFQCNIYSYVAHDCVIGDFVTFAPKVCCNGNVHIGDGAYIGTGAILRQGRPDKPLIIGAGATVGMGAIVTKDVDADMTVVGNPAHPI